MSDSLPPVTYRTQIGFFPEGGKGPCAVNMEVDAWDYQSGSSSAKFALTDKDGNWMGAVLIGEREMKRLAMQLLMAIR